MMAGVFSAAPRNETPRELLTASRPELGSHDVMQQTENAPRAEAPTFDEETPPSVSRTTLAAWRAELARIREEERKRPQDLPGETGRLLEIVGQALAQDGGPLPAHDIVRIEELTHVDVTYR
jgi:hypothetical protein